MKNATNTLDDLARLLNGRVKIMRDGTRTHDEITVKYAPTNLRFSSSENSVIEKVWNEKRRTGVKLYNGKLFHFKCLTKAGTKLVLLLSNTNYKAFVGTSSTRFRQAFPKRKTLPCPVGVAAVVRGLDGKILLGFRAKGLAGAYPDQFDVPAGWLERDLDLSRSQVVLADALYRELEEEEGVTRSDILKTEYLGMIRDTAVNALGIVYQVFLNINLSDLSRRAPTSIEFSRHVQLEASPEPVARFLSNKENGITPGGACAIFLCLEAARLHHT